MSVLMGPDLQCPSNTNSPSISHLLCFRVSSNVSTFPAIVAVIRAIKFTFLPVTGTILHVMFSCQVSRGFGGNDSWFTCTRLLSTLRSIKHVKAALCRSSISYFECPFSVLGRNRESRLYCSVATEMVHHKVTMILCWCDCIPTASSTV